MAILVTGAAGFIGMHVAKHCLANGHTVVGVDNLNDYYDVALKERRIALLDNQEHFVFHRFDLRDRDATGDLFQSFEFQTVIHMAAQAGVRYSLEAPQTYIDSNLVAFGNILEGCRQRDVKHLIYASSSSVYGANTHIPFAVGDNVDHPISLYAATKKSNELMAHAYSHLFQLPTTGLRLFTVYGPWGRPDMALYLFTQAILEGRPIDIYNNGEMKRDFTYVDDVVESVYRLMSQPATENPDWTGDAPDPATSNAPYRIYNVGCHQPVALLDFIETLEECLQVKAIRNYLPLQPGDVPTTFADVSALRDHIDYEPHTSLRDGIEKFVRWYQSYHSRTEKGANNIAGS